MSNIQPTPTGYESVAAGALAGMAHSIACVMVGDHKPHEMAVKLLRIALLNAEDYGGTASRKPVESHAAIDATVAFERGDDR